MNIFNEKNLFSGLAFCNNKKPVSYNGSLLVIIITIFLFAEAID